MINIDKKNFQKEVIEKSYKKPVLVDFWAEWCAPCKMIGPVLEKLAEEQKDTWELVKLDTDNNQDIAAEYGIRGIPNVKLFKDGKVINEFTGALPEYSIREWLRKSIPSKFVKQIERARVLLNKGDISDAKILLEEIQRGDRNNDDVKVLLAKIFLFENPAEALRLVNNIDGSADNLQLSESIQILAQLIDRKNDSFPESSAKEFYLSAIDEIREKNFSSALEKFIEVIRIERNYDDDGARKACIAIFKYLGEEHEITLRYRRDFGSALYV
jgi:putative thioredoxin